MNEKLNLINSLISQQDKKKILRWEFLRKNQQYIKEYKELEKKCEAGRGRKGAKNACDSEEFGLSDSNKVRDKDYEQFCFKWNISGAVSPEYDPNKELEKRIKYLETYDIEMLRAICKMREDLKGFGSHKRNLKEKIYEQCEYIEPVIHLNLTASSFLTEVVKLISPYDRQDFFSDKRAWSVEYNDEGFPEFRFISKEVGVSGMYPIEVNMRYSKTEIIKNFSNAIDTWKTLFELAYKNRLFEEFCSKRNITNFPVSEKIAEEFDGFYKQMLQSRMPSKNKKVQDTKLYEKYLKVWDLREKEGKTWSQIQKALNLNSIQTARDYKKSADKLINDGFPL